MFLDIDMMSVTPLTMPKKKSTVDLTLSENLKIWCQNIMIISVLTHNMASEIKSEYET